MWIEFWCPNLWIRDLRRARRGSLEDNWGYRFKFSWLLPLKFGKKHEDWSFFSAYLRALAKSFPLSKKVWEVLEKLPIGPLRFGKNYLRLEFNFRGRVQEKLDTKSWVGYFRSSGFGGNWVPTQKEMSNGWGTSCILEVIGRNWGMSVLVVFCVCHCLCFE